MANDKQNTSPNVPNLRFPEFSGEWETLFVDDVCPEFQSGKNIKAENIKSEGLYPVYGGNGLRGYTDIYNHDGTYVLIGRQGALCGNVRLVEGRNYITEHAIAVSSSNEHCIYFLYYLFYKMNLGQYSDQSAQPGLAVNKLLRLKLHIPLKDEQTKIAKILTLLDTRIATQNKIIEDLKKLKVAICNKLIDNLVNHEPLIRFTEVYSKAGEGGTPETSKSEYYENGNIPFIKIDDLSNKYIISNKDFITDLGLQKSSAWIIPTHSLIYSNGATIGAISINTYEVCTKQGILGIVPKTSISVEYLYCLMSSNYFSKQVHRIITHGTMATAYLKDINKIKVPIPCMQKQLEIANTISSVTNKIGTELNILSLLLKQKQYLLQQMFI